VPSLPVFAGPELCSLEGGKGVRPALGSQSRAALLLYREG
jgi:hypothetical protein